MNLSDASHFGLFSPEAKADIESICDRYGHGDCWYFALAQHELTGWPLIQLQADGAPVHAGVRAPDGRIWDAYGLDTDSLVAGRYHQCFEQDTGFHWAALDTELLYFLSSPQEDDILCAADHVVMQLQLMPVSFRQQVIDAARVRNVPVDALVRSADGKNKMVSPARARVLLDTQVERCLEEGELDELSRLSEIGHEAVLVAMENVVDGEFMGSEWKMRRSDLWAAILPETNPAAGGPVRLQYYDKNGISGHSTFASVRQAIESLSRDRYLLPDNGAMLRLQQDDAWAAGMQFLDRARQSWMTQEGDAPTLSPGP